MSDLEKARREAEFYLAQQLEQDETFNELVRRAFSDSYRGKRIRLKTQRGKRQRFEHRRG